MCVKWASHYGPEQSLYDPVVLPKTMPVKLPECAMGWSRYSDRTAWLWCYKVGRKKKQKSKVCNPVKGGFYFFKRITWSFIDTSKFYNITWVIRKPNSSQAKKPNIFYCVLFYISITFLMYQVDSWVMGCTEEIFYLPGISPGIYRKIFRINRTGVTEKDTQARGWTLTSAAVLAF